MQINRQNQKAFILVNCLTMIRIPLSVLAYKELSVENVEIIFYLLLFFMIAVSDFFDGKLARIFRTQSNFGAVADVVCDFFYIMTSCYALYRQGLFPLWMLILITAKLLEFIMTSKIIQNKNGCRHIFILDYAGRYTAVGFYILPVIILMLSRLLSISVFSCVVYTVYGVLLFFSMLSSIQRIGMSMKA